MKTVSVKDVIKGNFCVSSEDGDKLYELIVDSLANKNQINLSFKDICVLTSAFLNNAIGRLFENYTEDDFHKYVKIEDVNELDRSLISRVIKNAKRYYKDRHGFSKIYEESIAEN